MAGSYNACVDKETGKLLVNEDLIRMVENLGDAYEAIEEMYGMIWYLAKNIQETREVPASVMVEFARKYYQDGLAASPGTDGYLPEEDESEGHRSLKWVGPITDAIRNSPFVDEPHEVEIGVVLRGDNAQRLAAKQRISRFTGRQEDPLQLVANFSHVLGKLAFEVEDALRSQLGVPSITEASRLEWETRWRARQQALNNLRDRGLL